MKVGCWWSGFLLTGMIAIMAAIPIIGFPKELPDAAEVRAARVSEAHVSSTSEHTGLQKSSPPRAAGYSVEASSTSAAQGPDPSRVGPHTPSNLGLHNPTNSTPTPTASDVAGQAAKHPSTATLACGNPTVAIMNNPLTHHQPPVEFTGAGLVRCAFLSPSSSAIPPSGASPWPPVSKVCFPFSHLPAPARPYLYHSFLSLLNLSISVINL